MAKRDVVRANGNHDVAHRRLTDGQSVDRDVRPRYALMLSGACGGSTAIAATRPAATSTLRTDS
jgi:hypothetical protein